MTRAIARHWKFATALAAVALGTAILATGPAAAQKSQDRIRLAITDAFDGINPYTTPQIEGNFFYGTLYETMLVFDTGEGEFKPVLATSWKRTSPTTLEFELRHDVTFHNGSKLDADDLVTVFNWAADPKQRLRLHNRYNWLKAAEKLGPYKIRLTAREPEAGDLFHLASSFVALDSDYFKSLENKSDYGRKAVGTGPIKMASFDQAKGVLVERVDNHPRGPKIRYKQMEGLFIPEDQTQSARMLAGSLEAMRASTKEVFDQFKAMAKYQAYSRKQHNVLMMNVDARGRSGNKALQNAKVRRAMFMAIDRGLIAKNLIPGNSEVVDAFCFKVEMLACDYDSKPPSYDPAAAKKLLAEAGYPNGFELEIYGRELPRDSAIAIADMLRQIGITAKVNIVQQTVYNKKRSAGEMPVLVYSSPVGARPDASSPFQQQFASKGRSFVDDPKLFSAIAKAEGIHDVAERKKLYKEAFRILNENAYYLPIAVWPDTWILADTVTVHPGTWNDHFTRAHDFGWK